MPRPARFSTVIAIAVALAPLAGCDTDATPAATVASDADAHRQHILERSRAHAELWRQGLVDTVLTFYADDAAVMFPDAPDMRGRQAIGEALREMFATTVVDSLAITVDTVEIYGETAYEWGRYREVMRQGSAAPARIDGRYLMQWRRQPDGQWRILRFTGNERARTA